MKHITTLTKELSELANACAEEITRPVLNCVHIEGGKASASDGFILVECPCNSEEAINIPGKDLLKVKGEEALVYSGEGRVIISCERVEIATESIPGSFPDTDRLYPTSEPLGVVALDPKLLTKVLKSISKDEPIYLAIRKPDEAVEFIAGDVVGMIMPYFVDFKTIKWHYQREQNATK